mgnify:CR=1 FL=1
MRSTRHGLTHRLSTRRMFAIMLRLALFIMWPDQLPHPALMDPMSYISTTDIG